MTTISRPRITWPDFAWLTWRQHRTAVVLTTLFALAAGLVIVLRTARSIADPGREFTWWIMTEWMPYAPTVLAALVGMFWAAPLISREYENRTHLFSWSQDVSPRRWLAGKVAVLAAVAVVLAAALSLVAQNMVHAFSYNPFSNAAFEASPFLQIAYTLCGFALGLAFSALFRQTLLAMGATLVVFVGLRGFLAVFVRPYYVQPDHSFRAWDPPGVPYVPQVPPDGWNIDSGYGDAWGNPVELPSNIGYDCSRAGSAEAQTECLKSHGVAGHFATYHPPQRLPALRWIEFGIYAVLAAGLVTFAFFLVQRRRRI
jgi:hypothetical protein